MRSIDSRTVKHYLRLLNRLYPPSRGPLLALVLTESGPAGSVADEQFSVTSVKPRVESSQAIRN